jgi:hypothetical protein
MGELQEFPDVEEFNETFREAASACNGFLYYGDRLEGQIAFVKWMRNNPEKSSTLMKEKSSTLMKDFEK